MSGPLTLRAEITWRGRKRPSEMPAPDAVHDHSSGQRRGIADDLVRQLEPTGADAKRLGLTLRKHGKEAARHNFTRSGYAPVDEYGQIAGDAGFQVNPGDGRIAAID